MRKLNHKNYDYQCYNYKNRSIFHQLKRITEMICIKDNNPKKLPPQNEGDPSLLLNSRAAYFVEESEEEVRSLTSALLM